MKDARKLWIVCEGGWSTGRPTRAVLRSKPGACIRVLAEAEVEEGSELFILYKAGQGDLVLAASIRREVVERLRERLGKVGTSYEIAPLPVTRE